MAHAEIVVNCGYAGMNPVQFGYESCAPGHFFGPAVRTHWLLHYIRSGKGIFVRNGERIPVNPGEIFVISPYEKTFYQADGAEPWDYIWIGFTVEGDVPEVFGHPVLKCPEAGVVFEEMCFCWNYDNGRSAFLAACLWKLVGLLLEAGKSGTDYVDKALNCIHSEYSTGITVSEIARRLNLDRSYFSTVFSQKVGMPPRDYLRTFRMNKAAELMTLYGEKPSTVALSVGYGDLFHFSKSFKQHFGLSPRAYLRTHKPLR